MSNPETKIQTAIMIALSEAGCTVFRNETAGVWVGKVIHRDAGGTVTLGNARPMRAGLMVGSSDIIGVGPDGRFLAIEVKTKTGRASTEQKTFIDIINKSGGIAGIARSVEEALDLIRSASPAR